MFDKIREEIASIKARDPAVRSGWEVIFLYPSYKAVRSYRRAHWFYERGHFFIARWISQRSRHKTGIEIHPGAKIAGGVFIDHGSGVVIGETAEVATGVVIYQGATLGGTGKETGKRHPTIEKDCIISCGAKVLGSITIGEGTRIGAGAVVLKDIPPHATVVGVPGRVVRINGEKPNNDLIPETVNPYLKDIEELRARVALLEQLLLHNQPPEENKQEQEESKHDSI